MIHTQHQHWYGFDRYIFIDTQEGCSVQLETPNDTGKAWGEDFHMKSRRRFEADALLCALWVDTARRGKGCGLKMMLAAEDKARRLGCKAIALTHDIREAPEWTRKWYRRRGYETKKMGRFEWLMVKSLQPGKATGGECPAADNEGKAEP